jgi:hypothetical protein
MSSEKATIRTILSAVVSGLGVISTGSYSFYSVEAEPRDISIISLDLMASHVSAPDGCGDMIDNSAGLYQSPNNQLFYIQLERVSLCNH